VPNDKSHHRNQSTAYRFSQNAKRPSRAFISRTTGYFSRAESIRLITSQVITMWQCPARVIATMARVQFHRLQKPPAAVDMRHPHRVGCGCTFVTIKASKGQP
jgi:hypothetical protein